MDKDLRLCDACKHARIVSEWTGGRACRCSKDVYTGVNVPVFACRQFEPRVQARQCCIESFTEEIA